MAEVNASITQLFKDKLKPGQAAQSPVYPKTIGEAVEVPMYKGAPQSMKETLNKQLTKKFGYQVALICPNNWKYLYTFPDVNSFTVWESALCAEAGITKDALWSIVSGDAWNPFTQDELDDFDSIYLRDKTLILKTPLFDITNAGDEPITPPDTPTLNPWLRIDEYKDYGTEAEALDDVLKDITQITLKGNDLSGRIKITCYAPQGSDINFAPYTGNSPESTMQGDEVRYQNVITLDANTVINEVCTDEGKVIKFYTIDPQSDDINFVKIECLADDVPTIYICIQHPVTDSVLIYPATTSELPIEVNLSNVTEDIYNTVVSFPLQTKDITSYAMLTASSPNGAKIPFYAVVTDLKGNTVLAENSNSFMLEVAEANAGVRVYISTVPMTRTVSGWEPKANSSFPVISTTDNNYGTFILSIGEGGTPITVAKLYYTYRVNQNQVTRVSTSVRDLYLPIETTGDENNPYQFVTEPAASVSLEYINPRTLTQNSTLKDALIRAFGFEITLQNVPASDVDTYYNYYFSNLVSNVYSLEMATTQAYHFYKRTAIDANGTTINLDNTEYYKGDYISKNGLPIKAENGALKSTSIKIYYPIESPFVNTPASAFTTGVSNIITNILGGNLCIYCEHSDRASLKPNKTFVPSIDNVTIQVHNELRASSNTPSEILFNEAVFNINDTNVVAIQSKETISDVEKLSILSLPAYFMYETVQDSNGNPFSAMYMSDFANLHTIGEYAFAKCSNLEEVTLPDSVTSIGTGAFKECTSLETINIPINMKVIKPETFYKTSVVTDPVLQAIVLPNKLTTIGARAFAENTNVGRVTVPANIISIGDECFLNCTNLATVTFNGESNLKTLGRGAFANCSSLLSIAIPNGVTVLEAGTFSGCSSLTTVDLGTGIGVLPGTSLFNGCTAITDLYLRFTTEVEGSSVGVVWPMPIGGTRFTFEDEVKENPNFTIHVPSEVLEWYQNNEFWLAQVGDDSSRIVAIED